MAENWTQGEWKIHKSLPDDVIYSETEEGIVTIARIRYQEVPESVQDANAQLIAQAPAMYKALKAARISIIDDRYYQEFKPLLKTIDAVISEIDKGVSK